MLQTHNTVDGMVLSLMRDGAVPCVPSVRTRMPCELIRAWLAGPKVRVCPLRGAVKGTTKMFAMRISAAPPPHPSCLSGSHVSRPMAEHDAGSLYSLLYYHYRFIVDRK